MSFSSAGSWLFDSSESQVLFNDLLNSSIAALISLRVYPDEHWEWNYFSAGCEQLFGYTPATLMADQYLWLSRVPQDDVDSVIAPLAEQIFAECSQAPHEYRFLRADGEMRWVMGNLCSRWDEAGGCWVVTILATDISDRKRIEAERQRAEATLRQREGELQALLDRAPDIIMRLDRQARFLYVNPRAERYTGVPAAAVLGRRLDEVGQSTETLIIWQEAIQQVLETGQEQSCEYAYSGPEGTSYHLSRIVPELNAEGEIESVLAISRDISDRKQLEIALHQRAEQERLLRTITAHLRQSLDLNIVLSTAVNEVQETLQADRTLIFRLLNNGSGQVIRESVRPSYPVIDQMLQLDECFPEDCYQHYRRGQPRIVPNVAHDEWAECLVEFMAEAGVKSKLVAPIVSLRDSGAPHLWGLLIVHACSDYRPWQTSEAQFLQQIADQLAIAIQQAVLYEQLWEANQQLHYLATHDALTQVANRRAFNDYLSQEWPRLAREQQPLSLILTDIDYFKQYNDTYGHPAGDSCLVTIAATLSQALKRPADFIARYGGEEFIIVLPNTPVDGALQLVQALQAQVEQLNVPHAGSALSTRRITLSFGVTWTIPSAADTTQRLLERADRALYQAKAAGRNRWAMLPPETGPLPHQHN